MIRVSSPGSPRTPSTKSGIDVKLYLLQDLPSSKLNLMTEKISHQISKEKISFQRKCTINQERVHFKSTQGIVKVSLLCV